MVEATGIEPVSENPSGKLSTSVAFLLNFRAKTPKSRLFSLVSRNSLQGYGRTPATFTVSRRPNQGHGTPWQDEPLKQQLILNYCCRLKFKVASFKEADAFSTRLFAFEIPVETFTPPFYPLLRVFLSLTFLESPFDITLGLLFSQILTLIVKFFTLAKAKLHFNP